MDITGKLIVFSKQKDNTLTFSTSVSRKLQNGEYESVALSVFFNGNLKELAQTLQPDVKYTLEDVIGFISVYNKHLQVFITSARITDKISFKRNIKENVKENMDDLPF